jgi:hypothetical protein
MTVALDKTSFLAIAVLDRISHLISIKRIKFYLTGDYLKLMHARTEMAH